MEDRRRVPTQSAFLGVALLCCLALGDGHSARAQQDTGATSLSVMGFNVLYDAKDADRSLEAVAQASPDVVCLREMTPAFSRAFAQQLGQTYPHRAMVPRAGTWGAGLASKFPLRNVDHFPNRPHKIPALEATVVIGKTHVRVACLHLFPPLGKHRAQDSMAVTMQKNQQLRKDQATWLVRHHAHADLPMIILGDLNEGPDGDAVKTFVDAGFSRACDTAPQRSCGATWPGPAITGLRGLFSVAVFEIDHILGRGVTFLSAATLHSGGSDHYPVMARFTVP